MAGSSGRLARGASHQKCTASAQRGPTAALRRSSCAATAGESGFAGAAGPPCCAATPTAPVHSSTTMAAPRPEITIALFLSALKGAIHGLDEHVRGPRTGRRAVARIVVRSGPRRFHLLQRRLGLHQCANAIADDDHHVAVFDDLVFV